MPKQTIAKKLKSLPKEPGVYFHKNKSGAIIYVGKAAVLNNRVRQYFQNSRVRDPKTDALVSEIADVDWLTVETELDALFLEAEMIKRYKPRYNIMLRDDKSDIFVRIDINSSHPTVTTTRRPLDDGAEYFGPFQVSFGIRRALKYLRRVFPYDTTKPHSHRSSLEHQLGLSPGLETGKTSLEDYRKNLRRMIQYLKGNRVKIIAQFEKEMKQAAKDRQFEKAAELRNQVNALKQLKQQVIFSDREFMDISKDQALNGLAELLDLKGAPHRIEGYDISHMQGKQTVASMVVFTNGIANKKEYRKFKMRLPGNDDFAHMNEVISRRFSDRNISSWSKPDLLLIDGGKGQLGAAIKALEERGVNIPAIGLAKRFETIIISKDGHYEELPLAKSSHIVKLLQRIRDESHRFALSYHTTLKIGRQTQSILEDIPTIGPATRRKLIKTFGSVKRVAEARDWELEKLIGTKKAKLVKQYLAADKKKGLL